MTLRAFALIFLWSFGFFSMLRSGASYGDDATPSLLRDTIESGNACSGEFCTLFEVDAQKAVALTSGQTAPLYYSSGNFSGYINGRFSSARVIQCRKSVRVPAPAYDAVIKIIDSVAASSAGGLPPALTPAQQTMLLFYTTVMQQTQGFTCSDDETVGN